MSIGIILALVLIDIMIVIAIILIGGMIGGTFQMNSRNKIHLLLMEMRRIRKMQRLGYLA